MMIPSTFYLKAAVIALVFAAGLGSGVKCGRSLTAGQLQAQANRHAAVLADLARQTDKARKAYFAYVGYVQNKFIEQAGKYEQGKADAYMAGRATAAAVRSGTVQLRDHWACPTRTGNVQVAGPSRVPDESAAELQAASVGRIAQTGGEADAFAQACTGALDAIYGTAK